LGFLLIVISINLIGQMKWHSRRDTNQRLLGVMEKLKLHIVLKRLIEDRDLTLRELSRATKIPEPTLSGYMNGAEPGKINHIRILARFFGISMETLLYGQDDRPPTLEDVLTEQIFSGWLRVKIERAIPDRRKSDERE
jgi:transcriptional regulator with XRE-family HTH domain